MSAYFENNAFEGFVKWMKMKSGEERVYAKKMRVCLYLSMKWDRELLSIKKVHFTVNN